MDENGGQGSDRSCSNAGAQLSAQRRRYVGTRIARLRAQRGYASEQLADLAGLTLDELEEIESGRRGIVFERLLDIADALDVTGAELVDGMM